MREEAHRVQPVFITGSNTLTTRFNLPTDGVITPDELRKLAWDGFKMLVAQTPEPPSTFTVEVS